MSKNIYLSICTACLILSGTLSFSQTTISITYAGSSLCTTCCNVFNMSGSNPTVGGKAHWPVAGGAVSRSYHVPSGFSPNSLSIENWLRETPMYSRL